MIFSLFGGGTSVLVRQWGTRRKVGRDCQVISKPMPSFGADHGLNGSHRLPPYGFDQPARVACAIVRMRVPLQAEQNVPVGCLPTPVVSKAVINALRGIYFIMETRYRRLSRQHPLAVRAGHPFGIFHCENQWTIGTGTISENNLGVGQCHGALPRKTTASVSVTLGFSHCQLVGLSYL